MWCFGKRDNKSPRDRTLGAVRDRERENNRDNATVTRLVQEVDRGRRKIGDLQRALDASDEEKKKLWADLQGKSKAITGLTNQLSSAESSRSSAKARYEKCSKERDSLSKKVSQMQQALKDLDRLFDKSISDNEPMSVESLQKARSTITQALQVAAEPSSSKSSRPRSPHDLQRSATQPSSSGTKDKDKERDRESRRASRSNSAHASSSRHNRYRTPDRPRIEKLGQGEFMKHADTELTNTGSDFGKDSDDQRRPSSRGGKPPASPVAPLPRSPSSSSNSPSRANALNTNTSCNSDNTDTAAAAASSSAAAASSSHPSSSRPSPRIDYDAITPKASDLASSSRDQNPPRSPAAGNSPAGTPTGASRRPSRMYVDSTGRVVMRPLDN